MTSYKRLLFLFIAAFTVMGAALFVACGGDDSTSSSSDSGAAKPSGQTGSDEAFVSDLCKATDKLTKAMDKLSDGPTPSDPSKVMDQMFKSIAAPMSTFASDFAKAKPPKDLAQWHADTSKQLGVFAKALKDGKFDDPAVTAGLSDSPIADMPKDAEARLSKLAEKADGCKGTDLFSN